MTDIFGIDIQKGSVRSISMHPRFCLVRVSNGEIISEEKGVSMPRLFRMLNAEKPAILAVDSVQEIAENNRGLFRFLLAMPAETKLVQVTGDCVNMESLVKVAARYNLKFDKTNPMEEARVSALIASYGGGYEVLAFAGITTVTVSRARSPGRGGWSQNRYARKIHGNVKMRSREIEAKLVAAGLPYVIETHHAFGGDRRTSFHISAPRSKVPVNQEKFGDIQVRVIPKMRDTISYVPLERRPPYVIVGLDPGTTVGLAIIDLNGNLLHLESVRAQSSSQIISVINSVGIPLVIATDKMEMPAGVDKVRRAFSAIGWTPKKDIQVKEKYEIVKDYPFDDDHQRDSLSAAIMAFRNYMPKFENLRRRIPAGVDFDLVRAGVIRGKSVEQILSSLSVEDKKTDKGPVITEKPRVLDEKDLEIARLNEEVLKLRKLLVSLSKDLESQEHSIKSLQRRLTLERGERTTAVLVSEEITVRDRELEQTRKQLRKEERRNKNLRIRLERMKRFIALQAGEGFLALKVLQLLARDHLKSMNDEMGVNEGDILYILKIDGWGKTVLRDIAEYQVNAVILPHLTYLKAKEQHLVEVFRNLDIPLLDGVNLSPRVKGKIGIVNEEAFLSAVSEWKRSQDIYLKEKKNLEIHGMVAEYQVQRRRDVENFGIDPATISYSFPHPEVINKKLEKKEYVPQTVVVQSKPAASVPLEKEKPLHPSDTNKDRENISPKKETDILTSVLSAYREERKKELHNNE